MFLPLAIIGIDDLVIFVVVALVIAAASMALSELLRPKPKFENARAAALGDFKFPTATEGRVVPLLWGTVRIDGCNVVWYGDYRQVAITQKIKTGLWSSKRITKGFKYYLGLQMALCRGRIDAITKIIINDKEVWTGNVQDGTYMIASPELFGGNDFGSGGMDGIGHIFSGRSDEPAPVMGDYLYTFQNPHIPYRGTSYITWDGGYVGNATSLYPWKFVVKRCPNGLSLGANHHIVNVSGNDADANPACVLYEILTNTEWGFGFPAADIDLTSFRAAGDTLFTEGNGFSLLVDNPKEATEILNEIQRQIDGVLYLDHLDGKYKLKLTRADYNIDTVPQVTSANVLEVPDFTRGTWDETSNQVRIAFTDRSKNYASSYAVASDLANQRIQLGALIPSTVNFPGVKDKTLASNLATRQLKYLSSPIAKATVIVDRSLWRLKPGDVVAWTDATLGFSKMPFRVAKANFGDLKNGKIELSLVQDIFQYATTFEGVSGSTLWVPPANAPQALPIGQQLAIEAPYAICRRDPENPTVIDRILCAGRNQGYGEISLSLYERHAPVAPAGAYATAGDVVDFMFVGALRTGIGAGGQPDTTIDVDPTPDSVSGMISEFTAAPTVGDMGQNLVNLIMIGDEFMAVTTVSNQTSFMRMSTVYRGLLDSTPKPHTIGEPVYLLFAGAGLTDTVFPNPQTVNVQIRPRAVGAEVTEGQATAIALALNSRCRRPVPPTELVANGTRFHTAANIDTMKAGGATDDDRGVEITFRRRDWRNYDEIQSLSYDAADIIADFPAANMHQNRALLINDPDGTPATVETKAWAGAKTFFFSRTKLLRATAGARPARLRITVGARHTLSGTVYEAREDLGHSWNTPASEIDGFLNMGVLTTNAVGAAYTAPATGVYSFTIGPNLPGGAIQARINGAAWGDVITAGNRTGTLAGVTATDTIEVRSTYAGPGTGETFLRVDAQGSASDAYAIIVL